MSRVDRRRSMWLGVLERVASQEVFMLTAAGNSLDTGNRPSLLASQQRIMPIEHRMFR